MIKTMILLCAGIACIARAAAAADAPAVSTGDILIADFEGETYGGWKADGEAFGPGPAHGTLPGQMDVTGYRGKRLVNSFSGGDASTGTLTSPEFTIQRRGIFFLIGGGKHPAETCMNLLIEGKIVRTATGPNDKPGGSERLGWQSWDVSEFNGKKAVLQIVDRNTGGWGHINVDQIVQCDEPPEKEMTVRLKAEKRYLNLPVKNGAEKRRMQIRLDGAPVREFDIELAEDAPDFWVFLDLAPFQRKELEIHAGDFPPESTALAAIAQDDTIKGAENLYQEPLRPQFHFSSRRGWNNDPNGLVYHQGEFHLYYQHNPYGWKWDNMHWGHAVSPDLVHWTELPIALYPKQYGDWCFSGSAVVDANNTAGFKTGGEDVLVAAFTSTGRGECIAYSNDRGRTFMDYEGNPVVKNVGRDPKVIWHAPTQRWVMAVYDEQKDKKNGIAFYTSPDLKTWEYQSRLEEYFECPEIFELAVDGNANAKKWVVYAGSGEYSIGQFDGRTFTSESGKHHFNWGNCFYASQTFNNIPAEDGRRIQIGWGTVNIPGMSFNQMMTFPCELTLRTTGEDIRMFAQPVKEIEKLHEKELAWSNRDLVEGANLLKDITGDCFHIVADLEIGTAKEFGFVIRGIPVTYRVQEQQLVCGDKTAPLKPNVAQPPSAVDAIGNVAQPPSAVGAIGNVAQPPSAVHGRIHLELLVDRVSIEIFGNNGQVYMPMGVIPPHDNRSISVFAEGGTAKAVSLEVYPLRSAWK